MKPDHWPSVRGVLKTYAPMSEQTWLRVGGPARALFRPADADDLANFLGDCPGHVDVFPVGAGSNLLVRDGGLNAVVVRQSGAMAKCQIEGRRIIAGAGVTDRNLAIAAMEAGLSGLEFMIGIPGTVGGAVRMNAGCFGGETADCLVHADVLMRDGKSARLSAAELAFSYRHSALPEDAIVISATFEAAEGDQSVIREKMNGIREGRQEAQPQGVATGGSTFKNPPGQSAWKVIDDAGCRGLRRGNACMSDHHCNFMINLGDATADDLEGLGENVRERVFSHSRISLEWEIRRVGSRMPIGRGGVI